MSLWVVVSVADFSLPHRPPDATTLSPCGGTADAADLKSADLTVVGVRFPPRALLEDIMNLYHADDPCLCGTATEIQHWPWVYLVGKFREDFTANCVGNGSWVMDAPMPSTPGEHVAFYNGRELLVVLRYKCPAMLSGRIAYKDDTSVDIMDVSSWVSSVATHS